MYSWGIQEKLESWNYNIPLSCYDEICDVNNNPQISRIKYEPFGGYYEIWTEDGYYWKFTICND